MLFLGAHDDADAFAAVASLTFWPDKQLETGNFTVCASGIIDVSEFHLVLYKI